MVSEYAILINVCLFEFTNQCLGSYVQQKFVKLSFQAEIYCHVRLKPKIPTLALSQNVLGYIKGRLPLTKCRCQ